jgi:hypothetical protein
MQDNIFYKRNSRKSPIILAEINCVVTETEGSTQLYLTPIWSHSSFKFTAQ